MSKTLLALTGSADPKEATACADAPKKDTQELIHEATDRIARLLWDHALHNVKARRKNKHRRLES